MNLRTHFLVVLTALGTGVAMAQSPQKHPRVAELEAQLTRQAMELMRSRFPDKPFLVTVSIDPLHRYADVGARRGEQERLPLSWYDDEEIRDEWDDPKVPLGGLINRVKKTVVNVSVPSETTEDEMAEVQQSLFSSLNLFQARDEVKIQRRNWNQKPTEIEPVYWVAGGATLFLLLVGLSLIFYLSARRISKAIREASGKTITAVGTSASAVGRPLPSERLESRNGGPSPASDVRFNDPLKTREVILNTVKALLSQHRKVFPTLQDMIQLDRFGEENPPALGALLLEFPPDEQRALFARSYHRHWLDALNGPGDLGPACLEMLQKLVRNSRHETHPQWEDLLIAFWRLDSRRAEFIRSLDPEEAFSILGHMPKSLAVNVARAAFPGGWGVVLDPNFKPKPISPDRLEKLSKRAYALEPLRDYSVLERYKQEKDLLDYLHTVEPAEEREIYTVTPKDSLIHSMRVPFYPVLNLPSEALKKVVSALPLEDWALAMFNVPKPERRNLEKAFSDKQKYLYMESLKQLDSTNPPPHLVGDSRQRVAQAVDHLLKSEVPPRGDSDTDQGDQGVEFKSAA